MFNLQTKWLECVIVKCNLMLTVYKLCMFKYCPPFMKKKVNRVNKVNKIYNKITQMYKQNVYINFYTK